MNEELVAKIQERIDNLTSEGRQVAQNAANAAFEPYRVAIEENKRVLALLQPAEEPTA